MNMHGVLIPKSTEIEVRESRVDRGRAFVSRHRKFLGLVVLPLLLLAGYLFLIASDQYESEAHFLVRRADAAPTPGLGMSQALTMATGLSSAQGEAMSVADYLTSHDAVEALRRNHQLVQRFRRPGIDITSRLSTDNPKPENLLRYYRGKVDVEYSTETSITTLKARAFRPEDSYAIVRELMVLGEQRVNILNQRSFEDTLSASRTQLANAEQALAAVQSRMTNFRQSRSDIDPQASGQAQIGLVTNMTAQLSAARAQLNAMGGMIDHSSPQYRAMAGRVRALEAQVAGQSNRLVGGSNAIANDISGYEDLKLRKEFLAKRYESAASSLQRARDEAQRQQLYIVRVVDANLPVKALFPQRWRILGTAAIALLLAYGIGWLVAAGVREHAA